MNPSERLQLYLWGYYMNPRSSQWQGGPGQVVLNAPTNHQEEFSHLKSEDIANVRLEEALAGMSEEDWDRDRSRREVHRLLMNHDQEVLRHKKFTLPDETV